MRQALENAAIYKTTETPKLSAITRQTFTSTSRGHLGNYFEKNENEIIIVGFNIRMKWLRDLILSLNRGDA